RAAHKFWLPNRRAAPKSSIAKNEKAALRAALRTFLRAAVQIARCGFRPMCEATLAATVTIASEMQHAMSPYSTEVAADSSRTKRNTVFIPDSTFYTAAIVTPRTLPTD